MIFAVALLLFPCRADGVITVNSTISFEDGVRVQAVIVDSTGLSGSRGGDGGGSFTAIAIKEVHATTLIRDEAAINLGLAVRKRQLNAAETWGQGHPLGYTFPPPTDPEGPWQGLVWPYRDQYDYFPDKGDPLGDDVGTFSRDGPIYLFNNIAGIARGGPTDPEAGGADPNRLQRGITGNGLSGPATYFWMQIDPLLGDPKRFVQLEILNARAVVVQRDLISGAYSEINVSIPNFSTRFQLPEPTGALSVALVIASLSSAPRRRRKR
jgi:hypothetical protein